MHTAMGRPTVVFLILFFLACFLSLPQSYLGTFSRDSFGQYNLHLSDRRATGAVIGVLVVYPEFIIYPSSQPAQRRLCT